MKSDHISWGDKRAPASIFHILEWFHIAYQIDVRRLVENYLFSPPSNIFYESQLTIHCLYLVFFKLLILKL